MVETEAAASSRDQAVALKNAVTKGDVLIVRRCLDEGGDVNLSYDLGYTALHYAAWCGHDQVARVLIELDADVCALTHGNPLERLTARAIAEHEGHAKVVEVLCKASENKRGRVMLNIYDVGCLGVNKAFTAIGTGAFHIAIEVYNREWSYECRNPPRHSKHRLSSLYYGLSKKIADEMRAHVSTIANFDTEEYRNGTKSDNKSGGITSESTTTYRDEADEATAEGENTFADFTSTYSHPDMRWCKHYRIEAVKNATLS
jgi:hypothetical protein